MHDPFDFSLHDKFCACSIQQAHVACTCEEVEEIRADEREKADRFGNGPCVRRGQFDCGCPCTRRNGDIDGGEMGARE